MLNHKYILMSHWSVNVNDKMLANGKFSIEPSCIKKVSLPKTQIRNPYIFVT